MLDQHLNQKLEIRRDSPVKFLEESGSSSGKKQLFGFSPDSDLFKLEQIPMQVDQEQAQDAEGPSVGNFMSPRERQVVVEESEFFVKEDVLKRRDYLMSPESTTLHIIEESKLESGSFVVGGSFEATKLISASKKISDFGLSKHV